MPEATRDTYNYKIISIGSLVLSMYGNFKLLFRYSKLSGEISVTPFSNFLIFLIIYWGIYYLTQILYLHKFFYNSNLNDASILKITNNLIYFNIGQFAWAFFFASRYYLIAEIIVIVELFLVLSNYFTSRIFAIKPWYNYFLVNLTSGSLPLSWLFFTLFWNGALVIRSTSFAARVVANVFIWDFLLIGAVFLFLFNDYTFGISLSYLILGLALNQLFTKVFALQWIFAFIISGLLFVGSALVIIINPELDDKVVIEEEQVVGSQTTPLLN